MRDLGSVSQRERMEKRRRGGRNRRERTLGSGVSCEGREQSTREKEKKTREPRAPRRRPSPRRLYFFHCASSFPRCNLARFRASLSSLSLPPRSPRRALQLKVLRRRGTTEKQFIGAQGPAFHASLVDVEEEKPMHSVFLFLILSSRTHAGLLRDVPFSWRRLQPKRGPASALGTGKDAWSTPRERGNGARFSRFSFFFLLKQSRKFRASLLWGKKTAAPPKPLWRRPSRCCSSTAPDAEERRGSHRVRSPQSSSSSARAAAAVFPTSPPAAAAAALLSAATLDPGRAAPAAAAAARDRALGDLVPGLRAAQQGRGAREGEGEGQGEPPGLCGEPPGLCGGGGHGGGDGGDGDLVRAAAAASCSSAAAASVAAVPGLRRRRPEIHSCRSDQPVRASPAVAAEQPRRRRRSKRGVRCAVPGCATADSRRRPCRRSCVQSLWNPLLGFQGGGETGSSRLRERVRRVRRCSSGSITDYNRRRAAASSSWALCSSGRGGASGVVRDQALSSLAAQAAATSFSAAGTASAVGDDDFVSAVPAS